MNHYSTDEDVVRFIQQDLLKLSPGYKCIIIKDGRLLCNDSSEGKSNDQYRPKSNI